MKIDFNGIPEEVLPPFKGWEKEYDARMSHSRAMLLAIHRPN